MVSWSPPSLRDDLAVQERKLAQAEDAVPVSPEAAVRLREYLMLLRRGVERLKQAVAEEDA